MLISTEQTAIKKGTVTHCRYTVWMDGWMDDGTWSHKSQPDNKRHDVHKLQQVRILHHMTGNNRLVIDVNPWAHSIIKRDLYSPVRSSSSKVTNSTAQVHIPVSADPLSLSCPVLLLKQHYVNWRQSFTCAANVTWPWRANISLRLHANSANVSICWNADKNKKKSVSLAVYSSCSLFGFLFLASSF